MSIIKKYKWNGNESYVIPKTAFNVSPIFNDEQFKSLGGEIEEIELQDPVAEDPTTCTKYQFVNALKKVDIGLYETLRTLYTESEELRFYWNTVQDLDRNNEDFKNFIAIANVSEEQLDEIFKNI